MYSLAALDSAAGKRPILFAISMRSNQQELTGRIGDDRANFLAELQAALMTKNAHRHWMPAKA